jgi:hypothetical protein
MPELSGEDVYEAFRRVEMAMDKRQSPEWKELPARYKPRWVVYAAQLNLLIAERASE